MRGLLAILTVALACLSGCATGPPPLPRVEASALPEAWLALLRSAPAPGPFDADVRLILRSRDGRGTLDGTLKVALPDTLRLNTRVGAFSPAFVLIAGPDSCELLLNRQGAYWISPRGRIDWVRMNPSAWARALAWALQPSALLRSFVPDGPGSVAAGDWRIAGTLEGTPLRAEVTVDIRHGVVRRLQIDEDGSPVLIASMERYVRLDGDWLPSVVDFEAAAESLQVRAELTRCDRIGRSSIRTEPLRPAGWKEVGEASLPVPSGPE